MFADESKLLNDFITKIKKTIEYDIENYPYPMKGGIKFNEKNTLYTIRKYIVNTLQYQLYDEVNLSNIKFDLFGSKILAELIKKCESICLLKLNKCIFPEEGLQAILDSLTTFDDFYTLHLYGVKLSLNNIKHIAHIKKDIKKKILYENKDGENKQSKVLKKTSKKFEEFKFK